MKRHHLFDTFPGFFDLRFVRTSQNISEAVSDEEVVEQILAERTSALPPNAFFDLAFYRRQISGTSEPSLNPTVHFLTHGAAEGRLINPLFDHDFYASQARLRNVTPVEAIEHANVHFGASIAHFSPFLHRERLAVHLEGPDAASLLEELLQNDAPPRLAHPFLGLGLSSDGLEGLSVKSAIEHYWQSGNVQSPHPMFDESFYRSQLPDGLDVQYALYHYLTSAKTTSPHPQFDPEYYEQQFIRHGHKPPHDTLLHFLDTPAENRLPSSPFVWAAPRIGDPISKQASQDVNVPSPHKMIPSEAFRMHRRASAKSDSFPDQWIKDKSSIPLSLFPDFSPDFYARQVPQELDTPAALLMHYLRFGYPSGSRPNGLISLPYVKSQLIRSGEGIQDPIDQYFSNNWHLRPRVMIVLETLEDTEPTRAWLDFLKAQNGASEVEWIVVGPTQTQLSQSFFDVAHVWHLGAQPLSKLSEATIRESAEKLVRTLGVNTPVAAFFDCSDQTRLLEAFGQMRCPKLAFGSQGYALEQDVQMRLEQWADKVLFENDTEAAKIEVNGAVASHKLHSGFHLRLARTKKRALTPQNLRSKYGWSDTDVVVLSSGPPSLADGADLFGALAALCFEDRDIPKNVRFVWHGEGHLWGNAPKFYAAHYARTSGGSDRFHLVDDISFEEALNVADLYVKLGRDGCDQIHLKHALSQGTPILLMAGSIDFEPLVATDAVVSCPAFDLKRLKSALKQLSSDPDARSEQGRKGTEYVLKSLSLEALSKRISEALGLVASDLDLPAPDLAIDRTLLLVTSSPDRLGLHLDADAAKSDFKHFHTAQTETGLFPAEMERELRNAKCEHLVFATPSSAQTWKDLEKFDAAIWMVESIQAELDAIYQHGASFDKIVVSSPETYDELCLLTPELTSRITVTDRMQP
ncbi:hypothetical protein BXY66_1093 [Shimia isoporae]|uniref:Uncharacterized protein n=1 Tax=Shimia isoporae TaxID=647720 RepID=A0A4V2Q3Z0_9RHOB|nr:hypothetical protein [Shimia isoporae]TCL09050.1 hypothetical protein BXY66_1093 [Shimia isoporae]